MTHQRIFTVVHHVVNSFCYTRLVVKELKQFQMLSKSPYECRQIGSCCCHGDPPETLGVMLSTRCRRALVARHFGERWDSTLCNGMCDHCSHTDHTGEWSVTLVNPSQDKIITKQVHQSLFRSTSYFSKHPIVSQDKPVENDFIITN